MSRARLIADVMRKAAAPAAAPPSGTDTLAGDWGDRTDAMGLDLHVRAHSARTDQDDGGELPTIWTPALVQSRLVEAVDTLARTVGRVGPKPFGGVWPNHIRDYPPESVSDTTPPGAHMISRAEEALMWPLAFLRDLPKHADALMLFCSARADGDAVARLLRDRAKRGRVLADEMMRRNHVRKRDLAARVAAAANARFAALSERQRATRATMIKAKAMDELRALIEQEGGLPVKLRPSDMMPDKVLSRTRLDHYRKEAAAIVATRLNRAGVEVR